MTYKRSKLGKTGSQRYALAMPIISFYPWTYKKHLERVEIDRKFDFRSFFPNRLFLDIRMAYRLYEFKIIYIGIMGVKCIVLSIPHISFHPEPLEVYFRRVETTSNST